MALKCYADGCDRIVSARGLCQGHYNRERRGIDLSIPLDRKLNGRWQRPPRAKPACSVADCNRPAQSKTLCATHYSRTRAGLSLEKALRPRIKGGKPCSVESCGRKADARGLCHAHHERARNGLEVNRGLRSAAIERACPICARPFRRDKAAYCSRECAAASWVRMKRSSETEIVISRSSDEVEAERRRLQRHGFRAASRAQGGTKPGLYTVARRSGLIILRWKPTLSRCFDCDSALRRRSIRHELVLSGDAELFCGPCFERRRGVKPAVRAVVAPPEDLLAAVAPLTERLLPFGDLTEEVSQELYLGVLDGSLRSVSEMQERMQSIRRQATDRHFRFVSLADQVGGDGLTWESLIGEGARKDRPRQE